MQLVRPEGWTETPAGAFDMGAGVFLGHVDSGFSGFVSPGTDTPDIPDTPGASSSSGAAQAVAGTVADVVAFLGTTTDRAAIAEVETLEANGKVRKGVFDAIAARRLELGGA